MLITAIGVKLTNFLKGRETVTNTIRKAKKILQMETFTGHAYLRAEIRVSFDSKRIAFFLSFFAFTQKFITRISARNTRDR